MKKARLAGRTRRAAMRKHRRIVVVMVPPVEELDLIGPVQVFSSANRLLGEPVYAIELVTNLNTLKVDGEGGLISFYAKANYQAVKGKIDSLLLVCGVATRNARDPALFRWMRSMAPNVRRLGAVCVGAFLLAEAGLLNGRRATAHWRFGQELAKRHPQVKVDFDPIWVKDGNVYTSAGISAGIDLALAWVEEDCGASLAHEVARELVLFLRRPSRQNQRSVALGAQAAEMKVIQELQVWISENLNKDLSVQVMADRVAMSVRSFERAFTRELGRTPAVYVLQSRVEWARSQLEKTDKGLDQIAVAAGFSSADVMRRAFLRTMGTTPRTYRQQLRCEDRP